LRRELDFALEPLCAHAGGQLVRQDLDNNGATEACLLGHEDARHPATAQLAVDAVAPAERVEQTILNGAHADVSSGATVRRAHQARGGVANAIRRRSVSPSTSGIT